MFGLFVGEFDLDEDGEFFVECRGGGVEALGDFERIDGVDGVEEFGGAGGFIGLKRADEMDFNAGERGDEGGLIGELLNAVFAKEAVAGGMGFEDALDGVELADGHKCNFIDGAVGAAAGCGDLVVEEFKILRDRHAGFSLRVGVGLKHYANS